MIALKAGQKLVALTADELDIIRHDLVEAMKTPRDNDDPKLIKFFDEREKQREELVDEIETILYKMYEDNAKDDWVSARYNAGCMNTIESQDILEIQGEHRDENE